MSRLPRGKLTVNDVGIRIAEALLARPRQRRHPIRLGALAGEVLRVNAPLTISHAVAKTSLNLLYDICHKLADRLPK